jgi:hypothetical protein
LLNITVPGTCRDILDIYRSINYWISDKEFPNVESGEEFFTEALEVNTDILCYFYINLTLAIVSPFFFPCDSHN